MMEEPIDESASPVPTRLASDTPPNLLSVSQSHDSDDTPTDDSGNKRPYEHGHELSPEKIETKKRKKNKKKAHESNYPEFLFNLHGFKMGGNINIHDIRDLVLWCLADGVNTPWMLVKNKSFIKKLVVLHIPGLEFSHFSISHEQNSHRHPLPMPTASNIPHFSSIFKHVLPTKVPSDRHRPLSALQSFLMCPIPKSEKRRKRAQKAWLEKSPATRSPNFYVMTREELVEHEYPLPSCWSSDGKLPGEDWVETRVTSPDLGKPKHLMAIDCEMCRTSEGLELTRVTLLNEAGILYDQLVKPERPILDYLTKYSGITEKALLEVTTTLQEVQCKLQALIDENTILIGHSLECDLRVLKYAHPFVIDTSLIYHHVRGIPFRPSLKFLAQKWLDRSIQQHTSGHDSAEDARACLDLVQLKLKKGPSFGEFASEQETLFERLERCSSTRIAVVDRKDSMAVRCAGTHVRRILECSSDEEATTAVSAALEDSEFVWVRFCELWDAKTARGAAETDESSLKPQEDEVTPSPTLNLNPEEEKEEEEEEDKEMDKEVVQAALALTDERIGRVYAMLPKCSALIVFGGMGDTAEMLRLKAKKSAYQRLYASTPLSQIPHEQLWGPEEEQRLEAAVKRARMGTRLHRGILRLCLRLERRRFERCARYIPPFRVYLGLFGPLVVFDPLETPVLGQSGHILRRWAVERCILFRSSLAVDPANSIGGIVIMILTRAMPARPCAFLKESARNFSYCYLQHRGSSSFLKSESPDREGTACTIFVRVEFCKAGLLLCFLVSISPSAHPSASPSAHKYLFSSREYKIRLQFSLSLFLSTFFFSLFNSHPKSTPKKHCMKMARLAH
ncbi:uncharacterized protein VTP21DRAFT_7945 [Calcarisporiella thermophila]|uniref:uncharacterized protein n=1 Tax=Calcarisporiella thermophila TaxID=911321 RepID=UPI003744332C